MYKHLVLWRLKADTPNKLARAQEIKRRLDSLPAVIKEIRHYEVGINIGSYDASFFDVGLISAFDDQAGFLRYIQYPEHDAVVAFIAANTADEQIVDFES
jgi:hypothetical protein